jgi:hypothetical protein
MHCLFQDKSQKNTWLPSLDDKMKCWHSPSTHLKVSVHNGDVLETLLIGPWLITGCKRYGLNRLGSGWSPVAGAGEHSDGEIS